jgi:hypothetical protein
VRTHHSGPSGASRPFPVVIGLAGILFAALLCSVLFLRPFQNSPDIRSDGVGYHAWVHAIAHGDLTFCKYKKLLHSVSALSAESADGHRCKNKYPPGVGLLQLAFSWPILAEQPDETGFSEGENRVVLWGGAVLLFATAGLMCAVLLRRRVTPFITLVAVAAFVFGTGLFHYSTYDASFSHVYSAFGAALLMWLVYDRQELSVSRILVFAMIVAWLYAVRQTNAALTLAVAYVFVRQAEGQDRWRLPAAWLLGTGVAAVVLLAYGRYATGEASLSSYGSEGFPSFAGHSFQVLVSYERGLFTYYPLFAIVVLLAIVQWKKPVSQAFLGLVLAFTLLYGSWHAWHLGAGFGHRGFVELAPFGMVVLAEGLMLLPRMAKGACLAAVGVCCAATLLAMSAYWRGDLPFHGAVAAQYWRSVSPVELPGAPKLLYSEQEIRNIHLTFEGAQRQQDGHWDARFRIVNGNAETPLRGVSGPYPALRMSWRVVAPQADIHSGWDERRDLPELEPGQSQSVTIAVPAPAATGDGQQLQLSIVQEGVFWSHDIGVPPLSIAWTQGNAALLNKME